jgi:hypothetical protein
MSTDEPAVEASGPVSSSSPRFSTAAVLSGARDRLAAHPRALVACLLAGLVVAGVDWLLLHDAVPTVRYEGIEQGRIAATFRVVVAVESRARVPPSALLNLTPRWLAWTVGLVLAEYLAVVAASVYALAALLEVDLTAPAVLRYGALVAALWLGAGRITFEGGAVLFGLPLLIGFFVVAVRLVPLPGRVIRGDSIRAALGWSWRRARGHGWALFGVVLVVGVANHLLTSVPVVGPVGSGAVAALHAGVVATVCRRLAVAERDESGATSSGDGPDADVTAGSGDGPGTADESDDCPPTSDEESDA